jgi:hypothetical protein
MTDFALVPLGVAMEVLVCAFGQQMEAWLGD